MSDPKGETTQYTIPVPNKSERDNESVISHKEKQPYQISTAQSIQRHPLSDQIERQINQSIIQNKSIVQIDHLNGNRPTLPYRVKNPGRLYNRRGLPHLLELLRASESST